MTDVSLPYTFVQGTIIDANEVNANNSALVSGVQNSLPVTGGEVAGGVTVGGPLATSGNLNITAGGSLIATLDVTAGRNLAVASSGNVGGDLVVGGTVRAPNLVVSALGQFANVNASVQVTAPTISGTTGQFTNLNVSQGITASNVQLSQNLTVNGSIATTTGSVTAAAGVLTPTDMTCNAIHFTWPGLSSPHSFAAGVNPSGGDFPYLVLGVDGTPYYLAYGINQPGTWIPLTNFALHTGSDFIYAAFYGGGNNYVTWPVTASDRRLKSHIDEEEAPDPVELVKQVRIHSADFQMPMTDEVPPAPVKHLPYTMLADEVQQVLPAAYLAPPPSGLARPGIAGLHTQHLLCALWAAVQQLINRVERLELERR
jgi:hypothetical protein